eukprot:CAMPEP_0178427232 /NCGR_PEP_ID=MMETSP0689_2-20121128/29637_1 /TAXON_ID=160604 /ORGANISM="Amphidinium massartii, Strain CS-259" /LENGTH=198 /DNA_ID=CAMNT_0020048929 /DNA_START=10 /DNA_END=606 /DNA_ORIENTATION=+
MVANMVTSGFNMLVGKMDRANIRAQVQETARQLELLRDEMSSLAATEQGMLLVLPYRPGIAGEAAACRTIERLQPSCIALVGPGSKGVNRAVRPPWLPPGPPTIILPFGEERPAGNDLCRLADIMLTESPLADQVGSSPRSPSGVEQEGSEAIRKAAELTAALQASEGEILRSLSDENRKALAEELRKLGLVLETGAG